MTDQEMDIQFIQMVLSLQAQAWQLLGKVASPLTGKIERNLEQAKFSIDMLEMLKRKTGGNLVEEETKALDHALYELRMNYVDEVKRDEGKKDEMTEKDEAKEEATSEIQDSPESTEPTTPES